MTSSGIQFLATVANDDVLPRIVLRDQAGLPMDTFTSYQRSIAESRQRLAAARLAPQEVPLGPSEWRLPHAPVPSRPDFTRAGLTTDRIRRHQTRTLVNSVENTEYQSNLMEALDIGSTIHRGIHTTSYHDIDVNSREWALLCRTAEAVLGPLGTSLLPPIYPRPLIRTKSSLFPTADASTDMTSMGLDSRQGIVSRDHIYPTKRHGTVSTTADGPMDAYEFPGFCSGCRRHTGWTFCYGCERDTTPHYHRDKTARTGGGFTYFKRDRPTNAIFRNNPLNWRVMLDYGPHVHYDGVEVPSMEKYGIAVGVEPLSTDQDDRLYENLLPRTTTPITSSNSQRVSTVDEYPVAEEEGEGGDEEEVEEDEMVEREVTDSIDPSTTETDDMIPKSRENQETSPEDSTSSAGDRAKERLYKVPAAPKCKEPQRKNVESSSPFSQERNLKIPKYGGIKIQKSDKKLTEVKEFPDGDATWEAPDKWTLKQREEKSHEYHLAPHPQPFDTPLPDSRKTPSVQYPPERTPQPEKVEVEEKVQKTKPKKSKPSKGSSPTKPERTVESRDLSPQRPLPPIKEVKPVINQLQARGRSSTDVNSESDDEEESSETEATGSVVMESVAEDEEEEQQLEDEEEEAENPSPIPAASQSQLNNSSSVIPVSPVLPVLPQFKPSSSQETVSSVEGYQTEELVEGTLGEASGDADFESFEPVVGQRPKKLPRPRSPKVNKEPVKKEKREIVKRIKPRVDDLPSPPKLAPPVEEPEEIPDTPPPVFTPVKFKEIDLPFIPPSRVIEQPPLPTASPPSLPAMITFIEPVKPIRAISETHMEIPPPMLEPPKQRRPPPAPKAKPKPRHLPRMPPSQVRAPGAHISATEIKNIGDPLDFLAKYCIIHPDRLPHYVRVFSKSVGEQMYRYADVPHPDGQFYDDWDQSNQPASAPEEGNTEQHADFVPDEVIDGEPVKATLTDKEKKIIQELTVVNVALKPQNRRVGLNEGDQTVEKISFTLDNLMDKYEELQRNLETVSDNRTRLLATLARKQFPQLADPNYKPPKPKGKKKKKKTIEPIAETGDVGGMDVTQQEPEKSSKAAASAPKKLTDADIVARLDEKQLKTLGYDLELHRVDLEFQRLQEKLKSVDDRIEELEDEKKLVQLFARDEFQRLEASDSKPDNFLRRQSILYQKMHPVVNVEMNVSDVEDALREINGHLLTKNEIQYIFHILNIPGRKRIDVQLFSVIAALSEKVTQVDPFIRKLINKFDFEALNVKMDRAKELFYLLTEDEVDVPLGKIAARMLAVELAAGGVSDEHTQYVLSKFNRENKGIIDFMDFLTYIPLFIEIHDRILNTPLQLNRDW